MKKKIFMVYFFDIQGESLDVESEILGDIAVLRREREPQGVGFEGNIPEYIRNADAIAIKHEKVTRKLIDSLDRCRMIIRLGSGYDNIDVKTATSRGIIVAIVPDYCTDAVSEHTLTFALMKIRAMNELDKRVSKGYWSAQGLDTDIANDVTFGIIGLGRIGGALSIKANGVGFNVIAFDPFISLTCFRQRKASRESTLHDLLKKADILSLNVPLTREGKHPTFRMIGSKEFQLMKKDVYIINTSRGEVLDTSALVSALNARKISGAALDVFEGEPRQSTYLKKGNNPVFDVLKRLPNVIITPHSAFSSQRSIRDVKQKGAMEIRSVFEGGFPRKVAWINPEVKQNYLKRLKTML